MPYGSNTELPSAVKKLPAQKQAAFRKAFNAALDEYDGDEEKAFAIAWSAAKKTKADSADEPVVLKDESLSIRMYDALEFDDAAKVTIMDGGYLKAMPRIARTGIQIYHGAECGRPDMEQVRVYRPEKSVFDKKAVNSYTHIPVTLDHPSEPVTADNWKKYAVGETGDEVMRDGSTVRVPLLMRDGAAIKAFKDGKNQLSVGYDCDLEWKTGIVDGAEYDAIQTNIRANHLAVVAAARGGSQLRIGDDNGSTGDGKMNIKTMLVDGIEIQVADTAAAIIQRALKDAKEKLDASTIECEEEKAKVKKAQDALNVATESIKTKDAEIATLKQQVKDAQLTPQQIDALVKDRAEVTAKAKTILGDSFKADGKSVEEVRRAVVDAKLGDAAKGWDDNQVLASFNTLTAGVKTGGHVADAARAFGSRPGGPGYGDARDAAYTEYTKGLADAWKGNAGGQA